MLPGLEDLPLEITKHRVLNARQAADMQGVSVSHWRRLHREGKTPPAIRTGARKLGWRLEAAKANTEPPVLP
jgi:predicted DNA-binding transcriptional regulator AlpA